MDNSNKAEAAAATGRSEDPCSRLHCVDDNDKTQQHGFVVVVLID
jgi:hypothetical protein